MEEKDGKKRAMELEWRAARRQRAEDGELRQKSSMLNIEMEISREVKDGRYGLEY